MNGARDDDVDLGMELGAEDAASVIRAGEYLVLIADVASNTARSGKRYIRIVFEILAATDPASSAAVGRRFADFFTLTPLGAWKVEALLAALTGSAFKGRSIKRSALVGRRVVVRGAPERHDGQEMFRARKFRAAARWVGVMPSEPTAPGPSRDQRVENGDAAGDGDGLAAVGRSEAEAGLDSDADTVGDGDGRAAAERTEAETETKLDAGTGADDDSKIPF